ncbi:hypothetical protein GETHLI_30480 [Geothrix limicola]|uniref:Peptidase M4 C-terminal domain-containing protein n=1 Tax=Geothrix limicola TaxID=2927978 RepID=A0ABQ5QJQ0_9BACT|nr:M4 family metallopeptidase [Geothrix limicola]GLH74546.1 hypothetical protein GETHLI_30480 [Geothrix limicola]
MFRMRYPATALAMMLAGATLCAQALPELPAAQLEVLNQQETARAAQAAAYLKSQASSLGLGGDDEFVLRHSLTNTQGECVARFDQIHQGTRVQGSSVVVKVSPEGTMSISVSALSKGISLPSGQAQLSPAQALDILGAKLSPTVGFGHAPTVEPIIFPTRLMGEMVLAKDPASGFFAVDPLRSAEAYQPLTAHVRGYRIVCDLLGSDGAPNTTLTVMMDADTGAILDRKATGPGIKNPFSYAKGFHGITGSAAPITHASASVISPEAAQTSVVPGSPSTTLIPAIGYGRTMYSGQMAIPTTYDPALKGYGLLDTTRGSHANYFVQDRMGYYDQFGHYQLNTQRPSGNLVVTDQADVFTPYTMDAISGSETPAAGVAANLVTGVPATTGVPFTDNIWGDGTDFVASADATKAHGAYSVSGQTAAAEAMNGMTNAYEFMKYAFNRKGLDGQDTAMTAVVNDRYYLGQVIHETFDQWRVDPVTHLQITLPSFRFTCGSGLPDYGVLSAAEPTLIGQALGDMLWEWTLQGQSSSSISEGKIVQRGFANLMSQAFMSLGSLHGIQRRVIMPTYTIGQNYANGGYATSMFQPSLDGISPDGWHDGLSFLGNEWPDYGEGPMDRAFFFMSEFASSDSSSSAYSEYLPQGMTGIGLEKTAKVLFKALTEDITSAEISCLGMRVACIKAATDLYGTGSAEVIATTNAFAAANIGGAYGKPDPVRVWFDMKNFPDNSDLGINGPFEPNPRGSRYPIVPLGEPSQLKVNISGTSDTGVVWTNNPAPFNGSGYWDLGGGVQGQISPEGVFLSPLRDSTLNVYSVQAKSKADPKQWAQGMVLVFSCDFDGDGSNDALDYGMLALAYEVPFDVYLSVNAHLMVGFPGIGEGELQWNLAAFKSAFGN